MTEEQMVTPGRIDPAQAKQRIAELEEFMRDGMVEGIDYGVVPGSKRAQNTLFKPGAQKLMVAFGLASSIKNVHRTVDLSGAESIVIYEVTVALISKSTGMLEAEGIGECNSKEKKYITTPTAEIANTVLKMAKKRGLIDGVLDATGANVLFTQDLEDMHTAPAQAQAPAQRPAQSAPRPAQRPAAPAPRAQQPSADVDVPACPQCGGEMYDNRGSKKNEKQPDFRCKDKECKADGNYVTGVWLSDMAKNKPAPAQGKAKALPAIEATGWAEFVAKAEGYDGWGRDAQGVFSEAALIRGAVGCGFTATTITDDNLPAFETACGDAFEGDPFAQGEG